MPEILAVFLVLGSTGWVLHGIKGNRVRDLALGGIFAGLAVLTKEVFTAYFFLFPLWFWVLRDSWRTQIRWAATFFIGFALTLAPWLIRNRLTQGQWILVTANTGHVFYLGNNSSVQGRVVGEEWDFLSDSWFPTEDPALPRLFTPEADRYLLKLGLQNIRNHPFQFLKQTGKKILRFWYPFYQESPPLAKALAIVCYVPVLILGGLGAWLSVKDWRARAPIYGPIFYLSLVCAVTISSIRYRFPVMPFLTLFAAFAIHELWVKYRLERMKP